MSRPDHGTICAAGESGATGVLQVMGCDAGGLAGLTLPQLALLRQARLLAAPGRLLADLPSWWQAEQGAARIAAELPPPALVSTDRPEQAWPALEQALADGEAAVVLASGDPLWFGIGRLLLQRFGAERLRFQPAPSSMQLAFARIGRPWQDASWLSLHGRDPEALAPALQRRPAALAVLTDPQQGGAEAVRQGLLSSGLAASYSFWLCERLGDPQRERVRCLDPLREPPLALRRQGQEGHEGQQGNPAAVDPLHLVLLVAREPPPPPPEQLPLFGLADGLWLQHADRPGLMTKREVRIQLLAELELPAQGVLWDVGAGVGSVGLEALRLRPALQLWALERRGGSAALIAANAERLGVRPAGVVEGRAPEALAGLPDPDRVLIGGGGRERTAVLQAVLQRLRPAGLVVIPLATVEALAELRPLLEQAGLEVAVSQHQSWRGTPLADGTRLAPLNPVLVLRGRRR